MSEFKKLKDLIFRFGPKPFLNYVKDLQSSQQDETFKILAAAIKIEESWIPWFWIKDMELVCENEFSFVYTARIKPPFIGSRTSGKKVHLRQVKDQNIALKVNLSFFIYMRAFLHPNLFVHQPFHRSTLRLLKIITYLITLLLHLIRNMVLHTLLRGLVM